MIFAIWEQHVVTQHMSGKKAECNVAHTVGNIPEVSLGFIGARNKLSVKPGTYTTALVSVTQV